MLPSRRRYWCTRAMRVPDALSRYSRIWVRVLLGSPAIRLRGMKLLSFLILNSPANPTGGVTPRAEVEKLVKGLAAWPDVAIMSDEIYDCMTYDDEEHVSLLTFPEIRERLILLNGFSKTWAMTGWRLGWSVWPAPLYDKVRKLAVNCWLSPAGSCVVVIT